MRLQSTSILFLVLAGCGSNNAPAGATLVFDTAADLTQPDQFFRAPWPSDSRLDSTGAPDVRGFPNPHKEKPVDQMKAIMPARKGFAMMPVAYFLFDAALPPLSPNVDAPIGKDARSPALLIDVDPQSGSLGQLTPVVTATPPMDDYTPANLLAVAPRPGFVLRPKTKYAFVVQRTLQDAQGRMLGQSPTIEALKPPGAQAASALGQLYAPLWTALQKLGVSLDQVAAATVFTTGDVVADTAASTDKLLQKYSVTINDLKVDSDGGASASRLCMLTGTVSYPQFQTGTPPFSSGGVFQLGSDGLPMKQGDLTAPLSISLPNTPMPANGYPLEIYFHGSGGSSRDVVDRGPTTMAGGPEAQGRGPAWVIAPYGIAAAGSALPLNPERLPGASDYAYLNFNNLGAFPFTFQQGIIEQRLFLEALRTLKIPPSTVAACTNLAPLPAGATAYQFDPNKLVAQGQSMGGMYTNLVSAVEPRIQAAVPTGAGGYWSYMILVTQLIPHADQLIGPLILGTQVDLSFMHPALNLAETAWEPAEPFVYMARLAHRPLPNHPARPIYEPVGKGDSYFPTQVYDGAAIAYGNQEAGDIVWPSMQTALAQAGLDGIAPYPVANNRTSENGNRYTGTIVQYPGDGIDDPHYIYAQRDDVKYQYGCFLSTFLATGTATVLAPKPLGSPCQ